MPDGLIGAALIGPGQFAPCGCGLFLDGQQVVGRIQDGNSHCLEERRFDVIPVTIQGALLADVDVPLVAGLDYGQAHLVQAGHFPWQGLVDGHLGFALPWPHDSLVSATSVSRLASK